MFEALIKNRSEMMLIQIEKTNSPVHAAIGIPQRASNAKSKNSSIQRSTENAVIMIMLRSITRESIHGLPFQIIDGDSSEDFGDKSKTLIKSEYVFVFIVMKSLEKHCMGYIDYYDISCLTLRVIR